LKLVSSAAAVVRSFLQVTRNLLRFVSWLYKDWNSKMLTVNQSSWFLKCQQNNQLPLFTTLQHHPHWILIETRVTYARVIFSQFVCNVSLRNVKSQRTFPLSRVKPPSPGDQLAVHCFSLVWNLNCQSDKSPLSDSTEH